MPALTMFELLLFSGNDRALLEECQALRYRVYGRDLGLDTPDLDHARGLDVEERDALCDFAAVRAQTGEIVGCIRMQPPGRGKFYAELEFDLIGPCWAQKRYVEGARFAVDRAHRGGPVPLLLFQAFRRYCREHDARDVLSVAILRGEAADRERLARLVRYVSERAEVDVSRGRPASGYAIDPPSDLELRDATMPRDDELSPMLRLLAGPRSTWCAPPAYCRRFETFNFLLATRLA
jgi:putative hemolysin